MWILWTVKNSYKPICVKCLGHWCSSINLVVSRIGLICPQQNTKYNQEYVQIKYYKHFSILDSVYIYVQIAWLSHPSVRRCEKFYQKNLWFSRQSNLRWNPHISMYCCTFNLDVTIIHFGDLHLPPLNIRLVYGRPHLHWNSYLCMLLN